MASVSCHLFIGLLLLWCSCATLINGGPPPPPPRKKVAIEGAVYCSDCKRGAPYQLTVTQTLVPGAVVKLQCNNSRKGMWEEAAETDEKGRFWMKPERVSSWGAHKCRLFLVSSPISNCSSPGNPYPDPDSYRWMAGFRLDPAAVNASSPFQYYYANTLTFFAGPYSPCLP